MAPACVFSFKKIKVKGKEKIKRNKKRGEMRQMQETKEE